MRGGARRVRYQPMGLASQGRRFENVGLGCRDSGFKGEVG